MTLSDFIEELNIAIRQDGHDIYCNASTAETIKRCLIKQNKMSKDTIYRRDAIDSLRMDVDIIPFAKAREYVREAIDTIYNRLEDLPSAESAIEPDWTELMVICDNCGHAIHVKRIDAKPIIEPERKKGKWIEGRDERFVKCSECGMESTKNALMGIALFGEKEPHFCPNCGSYNGGEQDE